MAHGPEQGRSPSRKNATAEENSPDDALAFPRSSPRDGFLQAIEEEPNDDGLKLIYADWLKDRDDPQGEFIHVQFELEVTPDTDERYPALKAREKALLEENREEWAGPVLTQYGERVIFKKGFVYGLALEGRDLVDAGVRALAESRNLPHLACGAPASRTKASGPSRNLGTSHTSPRSTCGAPTSRTPREKGLFHGLVTR
jgi:uncharacterized protein (TIGR02996 family)